MREEKERGSESALQSVRAAHMCYFLSLTEEFPAAIQLVRYAKDGMVVGSTLWQGIPQKLNRMSRHKKSIIEMEKRQQQQQ